MSLNIHEENLGRWLDFFVDEHLKKEPIKKVKKGKCVDKPKLIKIKK